ncbi:Exocyst complex component 7 [Trichinella spiralis]|uniref:Exocyst complex component 7 n=2 Tax=Trichinella TaxID=6333 RepID=A0A0V1BYK6_TRISP|nr:Exocyst complex component 7 [Trichinella spiralis]
MMSSKEIQAKLQQEEAWLKELLANEQRNQELTSKMISILDNFDRCLSNLQSTVMPLYKKTGALQQKQHNVVSTLKLIDQTLKHYNTANETDAVLKDMSPAENVIKYIKMMEKLKSAMEFFSSNEIHKSQLERVETTFNFGCTALEQEFKVLLRRNRANFSAAQVLASIDDSYGASRLFCILYSSVSVPVGEDTEDLKALSNWLVNDSPTKDYLNIYADVACTSILKILKSIFETSRNNASVEELKLNSAATRKDSKAWMLNRKTLRQYSADLTNRRVTLAVENVTKEGALENSAESVNEGKLVDNLFRFSQSDAYVCLKSVLVKPLNYILDCAKEFLQQAHRNLGRNDLAAVFCLLPLSKYIHRSQDRFKEFMKFSEPALQERFNTILKSVDSTCVDALEKFVDHVKNDQEKFIPSDCTVHQLTSNALIFLEQLMIESQALAVVLSSQQKDSPTTVVPKLLARVLSALGLNLRNKAEFYTDSSLKAMFMLNNTSHILKTIRKVGVLQVVSEQNRDVEQYYNDQIALFKSQYMQSWINLGAILAYFQQNYCLASPLLNQRPREKEREQIKSVFSDFNRQFELITNDHRDIVVPDVNLASKLREDCQKIVLSKYRPFYEKYRQVNFTKNPDKYFKYTPESIANTIDNLFNATL